MPKVKEKITVLVLSLVVLVIALELGLRLLGTFYHYRAKLQSAMPGPGSYKILCLGDSYTFGIGAAADQSYPRQLEQLLQQRSPGSKLKVINMGQLAQNSNQLLENLESNLDLVQPDMVIVMTGLNNSWNYAGYNRYLKSRSQASLWRDKLYQLKIFKLGQLLRRDWNARREEHKTAALKLKTAKAGTTAKPKTAATPDTGEKARTQSPLTPTAIKPSPSTPASRTSETPVALSSKPTSTPAMTVTRSTAKEPPDLDYLGVTYALLEKNLYPEALAWAAKGMKAQPDNPEYYKITGMIYDKSLQYDKALKWFKLSLELSPKDWNNYTSIANVYLKTRNFQAALKNLTQAENLLSRSRRNAIGLSTVYALRSKIYMDLNNNKEALRWGEQAFKLNPDNLQVCKALGWVYLESYNYDQALKWFKRALYLDPQAEGIYYNLALIYRVRRQNQEALMCFKQAIESDPGAAPRIVPRILEIYDEENHYAEGLDYVNALTAKYPALAGTLKTPGSMRTGNLDVERWLSDDLNRIIQICRSRKIKIVLMDYPGGLNLHSKDRTSLIKQVADKNQVVFIDNFRAFQQLPGRAGYFVPDGHCNAKGYGVIAGNVLENIESYLPAKLRQ